MSIHETTEPLSAPLTAAVRQQVQSMGLETEAQEVVDALRSRGIRVTAEQVREVQASLAGGAVESAGKAQRDWVAHEQHANQTSQEARRLLEAAGSAERARDALEKETAENGSKEPPTDRFAKELGFNSYLDLFENSRPIGSEGQKAWLITPAPGGQWVIWNDRDLKAEARYATQGEALDAAKTRFAASGSQRAT